MSARDIEADYKRAYTEEYEAYRRAGRTEDAEHIAGILRDQFGVEVGEDPGAPERKDAPRPPENAVPAKPARGKRPPAKKPDGE